ELFTCFTSDLVCENGMHGAHSYLALAAKAPQSELLDTARGNIGFHLLWISQASYDILIADVLLLYNLSCSRYCYGRRRDDALDVWILLEDALCILHCRRSRVIRRIDDGHQVHILILGVSL